MAVTLGEALEKLLQQFKIDKTIHLNEAIILWPEVVGEIVARHAVAEKIAYGKLYVTVDSPAWRNELSYQKSEILSKLNRYLKNVKIKEIVLR